ncbi:MAG: hypothetical protein D6705_14935 [Deltaproteobacteria bacterium]|nr:MAG: hypothetical protein D6705_14935 [Deltaproteobacteria bacterium]
MATIRGTVRHNDLEGGFYELVADDGTVYRLDGATGVKAGQKVTVEGEVEAPGFGIHMTSTPVLVVESIRPA